MLVLDSERSKRPTAAAQPLSVIDATDAIAEEFAALQRENSALVAELRHQRRRRTIKRLRRVSFVVLPIARAAARRFAKNPTVESTVEPPPAGPDRRILLIVLALVIRRILVSSDEQTSTEATGSLPAPREVAS